MSYLKILKKLLIINDYKNTMNFTILLLSMNTVL